ncbi:MAG: KH domain-containing protein [Longicatena sp.]
MNVYTGKNLEEALKSAARDKNVNVEDLTYTITEESNGFLGLGSKVTCSAYSKQDIKDFMKNYLQNYFDNIEMEAEIEVSEENDFYHVNLTAENNAILIGKNGQTLQSINTVLKSASSSEFKRRVGVLIDINGYKEEKYHKVCSLALRVAKTVQRSRTDALLDPMPADERKAIHSYLSTMKHVGTISEGEGNQRRLKIIYKAED